MKKFLIFLVAIVVVVSFGLTIFYFVRNDEVINFTTKEIYCNVGDTIKQEDLGLTVRKRSKKTTYNYNAGGEEVTSRVSYDAEHGQYVVKQDIDGEKAVGGDVTLVITTSNKKYSTFKIDLHIGDGSAAYPYNITNQNNFAKMGEDMAANFILRSDIVLTSTYQPINYFTGKFDGNGHTISGLNLTSTENVAAAGLFATVENATIQDLTLENFVIEGNYNKAGALAGEVKGGKISCVNVENATISSTAANGIVGGLAGVVTLSDSTIVTDDHSSSILSCDVKGNSTVGGNMAGGLVGQLDRSALRATYAIATVNGVGDSAKLGGLVGQFVIGSGTSTIQQSYAVSSSTSEGFGLFIGSAVKEPNFSEGTANEIVYLVGNYCVGQGAEIASNETGMFSTLLDADMSDYKITSKATQDDFARVQDYVFYAIQRKITKWDENAWYTADGKMPTLRMAKEVKGLSQEFVAKDLGKDTIVGQESAGKDDLNGTNGQALAKYLENPVTASLIEGYTYNMSGITVSAKDIENIVLYGNGATIANLTVEGCLFNKINNCTIKDLTFTNLKITGTAKGLFGEVGSTDKYTTSTISNVKVVYNGEVEGYIETVDETFGGLAAIVKDNTTIENVGVENLNVVANSETAYVAGVVGKLQNSIISGATVENISLSGANYLAGAVAQNNGIVSGINTGSEGVITIKTNKAQYVGGVVAQNDGALNDTDVNIDIQIVNGTVDGAYIGGVVADNSVSVSNATVKGNGIKFVSVDDLTELFIGGIASTNNGNLENVYVTATQIGNFDLDENKTIAGKGFSVAGVASLNFGKISKAVVTSDIAGNTAAGAVITTVGDVDQVLVGFNTKLATGKRNVITGDVYVAGVAYALGANAKVSNIQTRSTIEGKTNSTISSLVILEFPNGTTFTTAVIDNEATGFGTLYTETWTNYNGSANKYNVLGTKSAAGSFTNVIINNTHIAKTLSKKSSFFTWSLPWVTSYEQDSNKNFFRYVNDEDLVAPSTFTGTYKLVANGKNATINGGDSGSRWFDTDSFTYNVEFAESVWSSGNGVALLFLEGGYTE